MGLVGGVVAGGMALALIDVAVTRSSAASSESAAFKVLEAGVAKVVDPSIPAIANHASTSPAGAPASSSSPAPSSTPSPTTTVPATPPPGGTP